MIVLLTIISSLALVISLLQAAAYSVRTLSFIEAKLISDTNNDVQAINSFQSKKLFYFFKVLLFETFSSSIEVEGYIISLLELSLIKKIK